MTERDEQVSLDDILSSSPLATAPGTATPKEGVPPGPQRSPSVRLVQSVSRDEPIPASTTRDSLQETRSYYGLADVSGAATSSHIPPSAEMSHRRTLSNATSKRSTTSRPMSPDSKRSSSVAGRKSMTLPLHRGFLSPKKPAAAIRLEERQRREGQRTSLAQSHSARDLEAAETAGDFGENGVSGGGASAGEEPARISEEAAADERGEVEAKPKRSEDSDDADPPSQSLTSRAAGLRNSIAQTSMPGDLPEFSSDDLIQPRSTQAGDIEKAAPHARGLSAPRPSFSRRRSSSRSPKKDLDGPKRRYQVLENPLSTFLCGGRMMTGGDNWVSVCLVVVVLFGITGVWFGTTGVWYWRSADSYGLARGAGIAIDVIFVYLFGLTLSSLVAASLREPGIIPRDLDPSPPMSFSETDSWRQALDREFVVRQGRVVVRYCETCRSYRPPRASHCRLCGNCVDGIDHHCSYLHTCVGKRTYLSFLTLLVAATVSAIYEVIFSAIHFSLLCHVDSIGFGEAIARSPGAAVSFLLGIIILPAMLFLLAYHVRLMLYNLTTVEQIRASASKNLFKATKRPDNPFAADSVLGNILISTLGRPQFPSWVQAWKVVPPERRMVNPALTDERWMKEGFHRGDR